MRGKTVASEIFQQGYRRQEQRRGGKVQGTCLRLKTRTERGRLPQGTQQRGSPSIAGPQGRSSRPPPSRRGGGAPGRGPRKSLLSAAAPDHLLPDNRKPGWVAFPTGEMNDAPSPQALP